MAWEPEPLFDTGRGLSAREVDVIQDRLAIIRTWIKYMGLGELEVLCCLVLCLCGIPTFLHRMGLFILAGTAREAIAFDAWLSAGGNKGLV